MLHNNNKNLGCVGLAIRRQVYVISLIPRAGLGEGHHWQGHTRKLRAFVIGSLTTQLCKKRWKRARLLQSARRRPGQGGREHPSLLALASPFNTHSMQPGILQSISCDISRCSVSTLKSTPRRRVVSCPPLVAIDQGEAEAARPSPLLERARQQWSRVVLPKS